MSTKLPHLEVLKDYPELLTEPAKLMKLSAEGRIQQYFAWARERHAMYLRRKFYELDPPWSENPVMANTRWCNVYRELDKVTQWFMYNVYKPNIGNENLWFAAMICRYINYPDSIKDLMNAGCLGLSGRWDWEKAAKVLDARKQAKKQFVTGAYLVNSVSSSDFPEWIVGSKPHVVCYRLNGAWQRRKVLQEEFKSTLEQAYNAFSSVAGFGPFLSYQCLVDLTYYPQWLKKAPDLNTFNSAGPGTRRGLGRIFDGTRKGDFEAHSQEWCTARLVELHAMGKDPKYWPQTGEKNMGNGWAPLSVSNLSSLACETDKYFRLVLQEGKTRSRYIPDTDRDIFE
jgi:hypothetical protein